MKEMKTLGVSFPAYKLQAIEQALREKENSKSVEEMLTEHVEGLYQKHVPAPAKKYLDALLGEEPAPQEQAAPEHGKPPRRAYTKRSQEKEQQADSAENPELTPEEAPEPEQSQSMEMGM